jgi:F-type H+-transporting ATPase subunit b
MVNVGELLGSFGVDWHLLGIQALNFLLVAALLYRFGFRHVVRVMDERRKRIEAGLRYADDMEKEKAAFARSRGERVEAAKREAEDIVKTARDDAKDILEREKMASRKMAEGILAGATLEAERKREQLLVDVQGEIGGLVATMAGKVLEKTMTEKDRKKYVESAEKILLTENFR